MATISGQGQELTEEELLGDTAHIIPDHVLDDALLDDDPVTEILPNTEFFSVEDKLPQETSVELDAHNEELDYDDDEDNEEEKETRGKFSSERTKSSVSNIASVTTSTSVSGISIVSSATSRESVQAKGLQKNLPSLLKMNVKPPPMMPGGKILLNPNFRPQAPPPVVRLTLPGGPPIVMPPPLMQPIVPRLPNGMPLFSMPPNHGSAGFGHPPPPLMPQMPPPMAAHWDHRVTAFLNNVVGRSRRRRRSSSSSSYSSSSRSSRSKSSSRSPRRKRRTSSRRRDRKRSGERRHRDRRDHRREDREPRSSGSRRRDERHRDDNQVAEECAKAVGVDSDYLQKIEEQKRKREEMVRKKEQRRFGGVDEADMGEKKASVAEVDGKKAYLCVTVKNMTHLPTAPSKIEKLAAEIGEVMKCWRFTDDQINLIFKDHAHAKGFLLKYNNKVLSGLRMLVGLEKFYATPTFIHE